MRWIRRLSAGKALAFAAILTLIVFLGWVGTVTLGWAVLRPGDAGWDLWGMLEGLSSAAAFATVVGGGVMALIQLVEMIDSRNLSVYDDVFTRMMSDEEIDARRWIYQKLPEDPIEGVKALDEIGQRHIKRILNSLDHLGFLLQQDWVTAEAIIEWVSPMVVKLWVRLGPYVDYESKRRHEPDYYAAARFLAEQCIEWRHKNTPDAEIRWIEDAM